MKKIVWIVIGLVLSGCSATKVSWDYDPDTNFKQYKSFAWLKQDKTISEYHLDGLTEQRVKNAVNGQLLAMGWKSVETANADVLINYLTKIDKKVDVDTFNTDFGYNPYYRPGWSWGSRIHTETTVREYEVGTLIIDVVDNATKRLIWRGSRADTIRDYKTPVKRVEHINKTVTEILSHFPPMPAAK